MQRTGCTVRFAPVRLPLMPHPLGHPGVHVPHGCPAYLNSSFPLNHRAACIVLRLDSERPCLPARLEEIPGTGLPQSDRPVPVSSRPFVPRLRPSWLTGFADTHSRETPAPSSGLPFRRQGQSTPDIRKLARPRMGLHHGDPPPRPEAPPFPEPRCPSQGLPQYHHSGLTTACSGQAARFASLPCACR